MTELRMIPDTSDKEVDWVLDPDASRELASAGTAPPALREVHRQFSRNVLTTILARVVNMARGVVLVPFLLRHLGLEAYGIWTTIFILVSYVGVTTLGISNVYIKYVAEFHARREYDKANALLSTGLAITIPLCGAIFLGFLAGMELVLALAASAAGSRGRRQRGGADRAGRLSVGHCAQRLWRHSDCDAADRLHAVVSDYGHPGGAGRDCVAGGRRARHSRAGRGVSGACSVQRRTLHLVGLEKAQVAAPFAAHGAPRFHPLRAAFRRAGAVPKHVVDLSRLGGAGSGTGADRRRCRRTAGRRQEMAHSAFHRSHGVFCGALAGRGPRGRRFRRFRPLQQNLRTLYLSSSRYANLCTSAFVAAIALWAAPILHVWLGPQLPTRQALIALFVVFSFAMQFHMLTGPGTSMFRGMGRVYEEFTYSIPNLILLGVTLPAARWIEGRWTPFGIGVAVAVATAGSACVLMGRVLFVLHLPLTRFLRVVIVPGLAPYADCRLRWRGLWRNWWRR